MVQVLFAICLMLVHGRQVKFSSEFPEEHALDQIADEDNISGAIEPTGVLQAASMLGNGTVEVRVDELGMVEVQSHNTRLMGSRTQLPAEDNAPIFGQTDYSIHTGTVISGSNMNELNIADSNPQDCAAHCDRFPFCRSFEFNRNTNQCRPQSSTDLSSSTDYAHYDAYIRLRHRQVGQSGPVWIRFVNFDEGMSGGRRRRRDPTAHRLATDSCPFNDLACRFCFFSDYIPGQWYIRLTDPEGNCDPNQDAVRVDVSSSARSNNAANIEVGKCDMWDNNDNCKWTIQAYEDNSYFTLRTVGWELNACRRWSESYVRGYTVSDEGWDDGVGTMYGEDGENCKINIEIACQDHRTAGECSNLARIGMCSDQDVVLLCPLSCGLCRPNSQSQSMVRGEWRLVMSQTRGAVEYQIEEGVSSSTKESLETEEISRIRTESSASMSAGGLFVSGSVSVSMSTSFTSRTQSQFSQAMSKSSHTTAIVKCDAPADGQGSKVWLYQWVLMHASSDSTLGNTEVKTAHTRCHYTPGQEQPPRCAHGACPRDDGDPNCQNDCNYT